MDYITTRGLNKRTLRESEYQFFIETRLNFQAALLWNQLPNDKELKSLAAFKRAVRSVVLL